MIVTNIGRSFRVGADGEARFTDLYERHRGALYRYCARRTDPSRVDDAVAETFLVAWRKLGDVPDGQVALLWLYRVAFRVLQHQWRSAGRATRLIDRLGAVAVEEVPAVDVQVVRSEEHRLVLEAAARLRPVDQEILRLTLWEELPLAEVAVVLDIAPGAVKQRAFRARQNLTREYGRLAGETDIPSLRRGEAT